MNQSFFIKDIKNDKETKVANSMIASHFKHFASPECTDWEWNRSPCGSKRLIAVCNGEIIGHYGLLKYAMNYRGKKICGGKVEGSFVDVTKKMIYARRLKNPDINRTFGFLVEEMIRYLDLMSKRFIVFGFPNNNAKRAQVQGGYRYLLVEFITYRNIEGLFRYYYCKAEGSLKLEKILGKTRFKLLKQPINLFAAALQVFHYLLKNARGRFLSKSDGSYVCERVELEELSDTFLCRLNDGLSGVSVYRNREFLKWRFLDNPMAEAVFFRLKNDGCDSGFFVVVIRDKIVYLEDILLDNMNNPPVETIMCALKTLKREHECKEINIRVQNNIINEKFVYKMNNSRMMFVREISTSVMIYYSNIEDVHLSDPDSWYITRGFNEGV